MRTAPARWPDFPFIAGSTRCRQCDPSGNFGRVIRHVGQSRPLWNRETTLKAIRFAHYPNKPPRLNSCFACTHATALRFYARPIDKKSGFVASVFYEVGKVDPAAPEHRADFNVVQPLPRLSKSMEEIAHAYWTASRRVSWRQM
jgi:hypothetical protein